MLKSTQNIAINIQKNYGIDEEYEDDEEMEEDLYNSCVEAIRRCHFNTNNPTESQQLTKITFLKIPSPIPTIYACWGDSSADNKGKDEVPKKPQKLKASELEVYKTPHYDYKEYTHNCKYVCPGYKDARILRDSIVDDVTTVREKTQKTYTTVKTEVAKVFDQVKCEIIKKKNEFISYMRSPDNLCLRQAVVVTSGVGGFYLGRRFSRYRDSLLKGFLWGGTGLLASGALCFPSETDEYFRHYCDIANRVFLSLYRIYDSTAGSPYGKYPCPKDFPEKIDTKKRKPICEEKKKK